MGKKKSVKQEYVPNGEKQVKSIASSDSFYDQTPTWSFSKCDFEHQKWSVCCHQDCLSNLMQRLKSFEGQQWKEILSDTSGRHNNTKNHPIPVESLEKEAQARLEEINLDDFDKLYSLTITGIQRLWGVMVDGVFCIVWLDAKHEICPSHKKHT